LLVDKADTTRVVEYKGKAYIEEMYKPDRKNVRGGGKGGGRDDGVITRGPALQGSKLPFTVVPQTHLFALVHS
jgi:hypothetical protein